PGGRALGAARYIEKLLTAFDHRRPLIYAGGPFSGRNPFPDNDTGTPSHVRPRDGLGHFVALTREQELRWRAELFGSDHVPGADQPLGYSIFSRADGTYHERQDHPMSTPNPDEIDAMTGALAPRELSADGDRIQRSIAQLANALGGAC